MIRCRFMLWLVLGAISTAPLALAQEDCWEIVKEALERGGGTPEAVKAARECLGSLTAEQLIEAARQCSRECERRFDPERWDEAGATLGFVYVYYPLRTDSLADLSPILKELSSKDRSAFWRRWLVYALTSAWQEALAGERSLEVADALRDVLTDEADSVHVREKIPLSAAHLLFYSYRSAISSDPAVKALLEQGTNIWELTRRAASGNLKLTEEYAEAGGKVVDRVREHFETNVKLFAEPTTPPALQGPLMAGMMFYWKQGFTVAEQAPDVMGEAFRNYSEYDEDLWRQLARYALELGIEDASAIVEEMMTKTEDEALQARLKRILWRHERDRKKALQQE